MLEVVDVVLNFQWMSLRKTPQSSTQENESNPNVDAIRGLMALKTTTRN